MSGPLGETCDLCAGLVQQLPRDEIGNPIVPQEVSDLLARGCPRAERCVLRRTTEIIE